MNYAVIIAALIIACSSIECKRVRPRAKPKIWLKSYIEQDGYEILSAPTEFQNAEVFETIYASKNGTEYVVSSNVLRVDFACEADYPIAWKLPNVEQFSGVTNENMKVRTEILSNFDGNEPQSIKYYAYLEITINAGGTHKTPSGDLACFRIDTPSVQSAIYVYVEDFSKPSINFVGKVLQVNVAPSTLPVILPCRPALPTMSLSLLKENSYINHKTLSVNFVWEPIYPSDSVTFDPHIGFMLTINSPDIFGRYKCVVDGEEDTAYTIYHVVVEEKPQPQTFDFIPRKLITSSRAEFSLGPGSVQCCSRGSNNATVGDSYGCVTEAECDLLKSVFMYDVVIGVRSKKSTTTFTQPAGGVGAATKNTDCYRTTIPVHHLYQSKLFLCSGPGIDVVGQYMSVFSDANNKNLSSASKRARQLYKLFDLSEPSSITIANKIIFAIETPYWNRYVYSNVKNGNALGLRAIKASQNRRLYIPVRRGDLFEGERVVVTCGTHPYFYAKGGWLRLNWKNGSTTVFRKIMANPSKLQTLQFPSRARYANAGDYYYNLGEFQATVSDGGDIYSNYIRGGIPEINLEMESLDCFAPMWNSDLWEKHTYKLNAKSADLPEIENLNDQSLLLKMNQTGAQINCTLKHTNQSRVVLASLFWEKDGKMLENFASGVASITFLYTGNETVSTLTIPVATHVTQGEYHCVAKNIKGQVRKVYRIFVEDGSGGATIVISGICVISLGTLAGLLIWRHWHLRRSIIRLLSR